MAVFDPDTARLNLARILGMIVGLAFKIAIAVLIVLIACCGIAFLLAQAHNRD